MSCVAGSFEIAIKAFSYKLSQNTSKPHQLELDRKPAKTGENLKIPKNNTS